MNHRQHGYEKPARGLPAVRIFGGDWRIRMIEEPEPGKHLQLQSRCDYRRETATDSRILAHTRWHIVPVPAASALRLFLWNTSQQLKAEHA
jgi:hypothetical protein